MFIIVESGSTKADWVVVNQADNTVFFKTAGINPATMVELPDLGAQTELLEHVLRCETIFFYGAGIIDDVSKGRIKQWLDGYKFKGNLVVEEDMIAAARACCGDQPGIVCILGTGSNSCVYDGKKITNAIPTLGYIFSDEGGGTNIGKDILKAYFYGTMPEKERQIFATNFFLNQGRIDRKSIPFVGRKYVASFAQFMVLIEGQWKTNLLKKQFRDFVDLRILLYPEHKTHKIKFAGSIAHYNKEYLAEVLDEYGLKIDEVIQQPIYKLIDYHLKHNINE